MKTRLYQLSLAAFWFPTTAFWYPEYRRTVPRAVQTSMMDFYVAAGMILNAVAGGAKARFTVNEANRPTTDELVRFIGTKLPKT